MRLCSSHDKAGVEVLVHGRSGGPFPSRQTVEASKALARLHRLDPARTLFVRQSGEAIAAGAFHNDVVAVPYENVLFAHDQALADKEAFYAHLRPFLPGVATIEVTGDRKSGVKRKD